MTKEEFKQRWESSENGGGITINDIAKCAVKWGISSAPRTRRISDVLYEVLKAAKTIDCEDYNPYNSQDDDDGDDDDDDDD